MIYKYVTAFYNLVNYGEKDDVLKGLLRIQSLIDNLHRNEETLNNLSGMAKKKKCVNWGDLVSEMEEALATHGSKDNVKLG